MANVHFLMEYLFQSRFKSWLFGLHGFLARNFFFRSLFILCLKLLFRKCVTYVLKQPPEVFCRCSWKFHKIHRKTPEPESLRPATLIKKRLWPRCLPVNFVKFLRTAFIIEYLWWLFLYETELYVGHRK